MKLLTYFNKLDEKYGVLSKEQEKFEENKKIDIY